MAFPPLRLACFPRRCGCLRCWNICPRPARTICCRIFAWETLCLISTPRCPSCSARQPWRLRLCSRFSIGGVRRALSARRLRCLSCCCFPSLSSQFTKCGIWAAIRRSPCAMASSRCFSASRSTRLCSPGEESAAGKPVCALAVPFFPGLARRGAAVCRLHRAAAFPV